MAFDRDGVPVVSRLRAMSQLDWQLAAYDTSEKALALDRRDDVYLAAKNAFFQGFRYCCASGSCGHSHKELQPVLVDCLLVGRAPGRLQKLAPLCSNFPL